jgi:hypothetical protein
LGFLHQESYSVSTLLRKMKRNLFLFLGPFLCLLFMVVMIPVLSAQEGVPEESQEILYHQNVIVPAIRNILHSLEVQNAPTPQELTELLKMGEAVQTEAVLREFNAKAARYFGATWKADIVSDISLTAEDAQTLIRIRIYLSSLIANAGRIALLSPMSAEDIRTLGTDLLQKLQQTKSEEDRRALFLTFQKAYENIFPEGKKGDLSVFRKDVTALLAEMDDAITILVDGRSVKRLESDLAVLQSHLQLVANSQQLTAWLARFDGFAAKLLVYTVPTELSVLIRDIDTLLTKLEQYLEMLEERHIEVGTFPERVLELKEEHATITTDSALNVFLGKLEAVLTSVGDAYGDPSPLHSE